MLEDCRFLFVADDVSSTSATAVRLVVVMCSTPVTSSIDFTPPLLCVCAQVSIDVLGLHFISGDLFQQSLAVGCCAGCVALACLCYCM